MSPTGGLFCLFIVIFSSVISATPFIRYNEFYNNSSVATLPPDRNERVLNFVSLPNSLSVECLSNDGRRSGVCLNTYECRIQGGISRGNCALGFGVCCVFTETCGGSVVNNVTYFVSPHFPGLSYDARDCLLVVKRLFPRISQIRLDFVHFTLGQPNRKTGICESDVLKIATGDEDVDFELCGYNSGQHVYIDVEDKKEIKLVMNLTKADQGRLWEIKLSQIEFRHRSPAGCLQWFTGRTGIIQTMNFADNGRHLANQDYTICMRQETRMCSIVYEPCDENSFRIGPISYQDQQYDEGSGFGQSIAVDSSRGHNIECTDRIVMPCDSEELLTPRDSIPGVCDLLHCGTSFCSPGEFPCRIESSTIPFNIRVQFGRAVENESPDDNVGMCLKYEQQPCS